LFEYQVHPSGHKKNPKDTYISLRYKRHGTRLERVARSPTATDRGVRQWGGGNGMTAEKRNKTAYVDIAGQYILSTDGWRLRREGCSY